VQEAPFGRHGVVVVVVGVSVVVVVGVSVVVVVGVSVVVVVGVSVVEVVGVSVVVVVGVSVVEVVGVSVVEVVLVELVVPPHGPQVSLEWFLRWASRAPLGRHSVCAFWGLPGGLWQMHGSLHFCGLPCPPASAREGISAAMALPAKSLSARRRLIEPSASALARSSKEWLVDSWLTCCPLSPKGGTLGD
jgi:hypothetical protein